MAAQGCVNKTVTPDLLKSDEVVPVSTSIHVIGMYTYLDMASTLLVSLKESTPVKRSLSDTKHLCRVGINSTES
jgi:hypothetical protein